jgi:hypothetical protein
VDKGERKGTTKEWEAWLGESLDQVPTGVFGAAKRLGGSVIEQSFLRSMGDLVHDFGQQGDPSRTLAGWVSRYMPASSLVAQLSRLGDALQRDPKSFTELLTERTPFRGSLPVRQGPLGEQLPNDMAGITGFVLPSPRRTTERPNPTYGVFREAGMDVGAPKTTLSLKGNEISMTPTEQRAWQRERGQVLDEIGHDLAADPSWQDAPVERRQKILQRLVTRAGAAADKAVMDMIPDDEIDRRIERGRAARYREGA